jgi:hypothetical protein
VAPKNETAAPGEDRCGGEIQIETKASNLHAKDYDGAGLFASAKFPNRATLARKWPKLRINRLTWRWRDDASGAHGADVASLLAYIGEVAR